MKNFNFENQGSNTYMVYTVQPDDELDTMSLGMLTNNKIPNLAPTIFTQMDKTKYIKYNVSAKVSVSQFFAGIVNKKKLVGVFSGIVNAVLSAEDYMIDTNTILVDLDYIYADVSSCETVLICLPVQTGHEPVKLGDFLKKILFSIQFDQTENCDYVARLINYLNSTPTFSLTDFKNLLESIKKDELPKQLQNNAQSIPKSQQPVVQMQVPKQEHQAVRQSIPTTEKPPVSQSQVNVPKAVSGVSEQSSAGGNTQSKIAEKDRISFMYLMQHYNKENAAAYKAQKAAKKAIKDGQKPVAATPKKKKMPQAETTYAVPGAPGQAAPAVTQTSLKQQPSAQPVSQKQLQPDVSGLSGQMQPQPIIPQGVKMNFGETTVLGGGGFGETTVLNAALQEVQEHTPYLVRSKNNERIPVNKTVFRIGKEKSYVDYFLGDNTAVSRSHANIVSRGGKYYVVDTNSTNHTYVNGQMISSNAEEEITHGTKVRFADEDFEFKLY